MNPAEQELIGAAVIDPRITLEQHISGAEFNDLRLGDMWEAIRELCREKVQPTPATVGAKIAKFDPQILVDCMGQGVPADAERLADQIREGAYRRNLDGAFSVAHQILTAGGDPDDALRRITAVQKPAEQSMPAWNIMDFINRQLPPTEWIVPGLFARGDRLVLTGTEGLGKSVLLREIAVCAAAGIHPFTGDTAPIRQVLYVDLENPEPIMMRSFGQMIRAQHLTTRIPLTLSPNPGGLNILRSQDRLRLRELIAEHTPDLLVIGPAYKLWVTDGRRSDEDLTRAVLAALDDLRSEFQFALAMEHHSPHKGTNDMKRSVRPIGSSAWLRWPEFGLGIMPADGYSPDNRIVQVVHWRGDRESRPWPEFLQQGAILPWVGTDHDGQSLRRAA